MALDAYKNLALAQIATPPSPATTGTTMTLVAGQGAYLPTPPFNVTIFDGAKFPTPANAEIARITAMSGDTVTAMLRAQEGSTARAVVAGDYAAATFTNKFVTDITDASNQVSGILPNARLDPNVAIATSLAVGSNPSTSGAIRLANNAGVLGRNQANTTNITLLLLDTANTLVLGNGAANIVCYAGMVPAPDASKSLGSPTLRWSDIFASSAVSLGTNPAQSGGIRVANNTWIVARNATNTADVLALSVTTANQVQIGFGGTPVIMTGDVSEKGRTTPLGHWITIPYSPGNFTAYPSGTWDVEAGDSVTLAYTLIGKTMWLTYLLYGTSVSGSPTELRMTLPGGFAAQYTMVGPMAYQDGAAWTPGYCSSSGGASYVRFQRDPMSAGVWPTTTNGTFIYGTTQIALM